MKMSILIAVENYSDKSIRPVKYAQADATELANTLVQHGFEVGDRTLLVDGGATKTIIESKVRKALSTLTSDDTVYFYYAGHGFSKNSRNFITCYDTQRGDLVATSIPLDWLFAQFKQSNCKQVVLFLDSCESGLLATADMRGIYSDFTDDELKEFFESSEHCVCFAACKTGEESWPSGHLKHGIWTYHLIEAFDGRAPIALERNSLLTSASLQNHLKLAVPKTLRATFVDKKTQTPWVFGAQSGDFLLATLDQILSRRRAAANPGTRQVTRVAFVRKVVGDVRRLSGFKKHSHRVPDSVNSRTEAFVASIADEDVRQDIDKVHNALRSAFGFKRAEVQVDGPADGEGTIVTPHFTYSVSVSLNPDDTSEVVWHRQVTEIREPDQVFSDEFATVFGSTFDTVEFSPPTRVNLTALIDRVEQLDDELIDIEYDHETTWCTLKLKEIDCEIRVTKDTFEIVKARPEQPKLLLQSFFDIQRALIDTHEVRLIEFEPPKE